VSALRDALSALLSTVLAAEDEAPEPSEEDVAPANLASMSLQDAVTYMWEVLDKAHRIEYADSGFTLNLQSKARRSGNDSCPEPLFSSVNREHPFWKSPVTVAFVALLDNYERELSEKEDYTAQEKREVALFLDALCRTSVMRFAFAFLKAHGTDPRCAKLRTMADFQNLVYDLWFAPSRRGGGPRDNSSGFEHVFVGEENNEGKITGLHNWVQYFIEEKKGNINYLGWTGKQDSDYADDVHLVNVKFSWEDDDRDTEHTEEKTCSTILCGSTVEFEFAALTTAFLAGNQQGDNKLRLGSERVRIVCYGQRQRYGGAKIGSAYLEIASHTHTPV
jgi:poly(U)-specific endoribonuclease